MPEKSEVVSSSKAKPEYRVSRVFDAPKRLVWEAWTKAEHIQRWFTPAPLTTPTAEVDFRPGGVFKVVMQMPDGAQHPMNARFSEIVKEELLAFDAVIHDDLHVSTTVRFSESGGKTTLDVHQVYSHESPAIKGAPEGWKATLDQLGEHVKSRLA